MRGKRSQEQFPPADDDVCCITFSLDGSRVASSADNDMLSIWDPTTGNRLFSCPTRHGRKVMSISFVGKGSWLATAAEDGAVKFWNPGEAKETSFVTFTSSPTCVAFSPKTIEGVTPPPRIVAIALADRSIRILENNELTREYRKTSALANGTDQIDPGTLSLFTEEFEFKGHSGRVNALTFTSEGSLLASASDDQTIRLWDMNTRQEVGSLAGHRGSINSLSFSGDGQRLASGSSDGTIIVWDPRSKVQLGTLRGHTGPVLKAVFGPTTKWLASTSSDNSTILWSLEKEFREGLRLPNNPGKHPAIDFSPDGRYFASAWGKDVRFWETSALISEAANQLRAT
jgi:WD40 repeat protein